MAVVFPTCLGPTKKLREKGLKLNVFNMGGIHFTGEASHSSNFLSLSPYHQGFWFSVCNGIANGI